MLKLLSYFSQLAKENSTAAFLMLSGIIVLLGTLTFESRHAVDVPWVDWITFLRQQWFALACLVVGCALIVGGVVVMLNVHLGRASTPDYVRRFQRVMEAPIRLASPSAKDPISRRRSYSLLQYIFECEEIDEFFAVDMALPWWYEITDGVSHDGRYAVDDSVDNESERILLGINQQFAKTGGCKKLRRLFVTTHEQLANPKSIAVFQKIADLEEGLRKRLSGQGRHIETRFVVWETLPEQDRQELRILRDMALWKGKGGYFALTDTQIKTPADAAHMRCVHGAGGCQHTFCVDPAALDEKAVRFDHLFEQARALSEPWMAVDLRA